MRAREVSNKPKTQPWKHSAGGLTPTHCPCLVNHNIWVVLLLYIPRLLLGLFVPVGSIRLAVIHLHIVVTALLFILILAFRVFDVDVLTAIRLALFVFGRRACSLLAASHCGIFALYRGTFSLLFLFLFLFDTVLVTICVEIGLGLLRRILRWCRLLRVPAIVSYVPGGDNGSIASLEALNCGKNHIPLDGKTRYTRLLC